MTLAWPDRLPEIHCWLLLVLGWLTVMHQFPKGTGDPDTGDFRIANRVLPAALLFGALAAGLVSTDSPYWRVRLITPLVVSGTVAAGLLVRTWMHAGNRRLNYLAEVELLTAGASAVFLGLVVEAGGWRVWSPSIDWPFTLRQVVEGLLYAVAALFLIGIANNMIRGTLHRYRVLPTTTAPVLTTEEGSLAAARIEAATPRPDVVEIERGKVIGNLERLLVLVVVLNGQYDALGFLMAAKGLVRSREFENRDRAEYILIGSLASVLLAVAAALCVAAGLRVLSRTSP